MFPTNHRARPDRQSAPQRSTVSQQPCAGSRVGRRAGLLLFALAPLVCGCAGVPLRSWPKLVSLGDDLLRGDPAELGLAIQADERWRPPTDSVPVLRVTFRPAAGDPRPPLDRTFPMRVATAGGRDGLPVAPRGRRWQIYDLPPQACADLARLRDDYTRAAAHSGGSTGRGRLGLAIEQDGLAPDTPELAASRWQSWLRVRRDEGFFELWSGTIADLRRQAAASRRG